MTEAEWLAAPDLIQMIQFLRGRASDRKYRLFSVACCREHQDRLSDERSRYAVGVAERYADGGASEAELVAAERTARAAASELNQWCLVAGTAAEAASHRVQPPEGPRIGGGMIEWYQDSKYWEAVPVFVLQGFSAYEAEPMEHYLVDLLRDIFGNPFHPVGILPEWCTDTVQTLARQTYAERDFSAMPILADALQDAGCDNADILEHCRGLGPHARGCWVVDLVLGKS